MNSLTMCALGMFKVADPMTPELRADVLKAECNEAHSDLDMHKESCLRCRGRSNEEICAKFGCFVGAGLARAHMNKSRELRLAVAP